MLSLKYSDLYSTIVSAINSKTSDKFNKTDFIEFMTSYGLSNADTNTNSMSLNTLIIYLANVVNFTYMYAPTTISISYTHKNSTTAVSETVEPTLNTVDINYTSEAKNGLTFTENNYINKNPVDVLINNLLMKSTYNIKITSTYSFSSFSSSCSSCTSTSTSCSSSCCCSSSSSSHFIGYMKLV